MNVKEEFEHFHKNFLVSIALHLPEVWKTSCSVQTGFGLCNFPSALVRIVTKSQLKSGSEPFV